MSSWSWLEVVQKTAQTWWLDKFGTFGPGPGRSQVLPMFLPFFSLLVAGLIQVPMFILTQSNHAWKLGCTAGAILHSGTLQWCKIHSLLTNAEV